MTEKKSSFAKKIFGNTTYAVIDLILLKVGTTAAFVLLVRLLSETDISAIGIGMGYLAIISYLAVALIRILLRDYPKISGDHAVRDKYFTAYLILFCLQAGLMLLLSLGIQSFVLAKLPIPGLPFLFLGMTIDFVALMYQDWIKMVFYSDLRQSLATKIGLCLTSARLACYGILLYSPSLETYTWLLIWTSIGACIAWSFAFQTKFKFRPIFSREIFGILGHGLNDYGLWDHFNRVIVFNTLITIDTVVLSSVGQLRDIASYSIALKVTSLLFIIPWQLTKSLQITLSYYNVDRERFAAINTFLKANAAISLAQLIFILVAGKWLIHLLFGAGIDTNVVLFTYIIAVGVFVLNLGWPLISVINNFCSLRKASLTVFLPALILGSLIYFGMAIFWGAIGMAYGKIIVYLLLVVGLVIFTKRFYPFPLKFQIVTVEEKNLFREVVAGIKRKVTC